MKITDKIMESIIDVYLKPIFEGLSRQAYEEVVENFCEPNCGHAQEGKFCRAAQEKYNSVFSNLMESTRRLN